MVKLAQFVILACSILYGGVAAAQSVPVFQEGQVQPGDVAKYTRNGTIRNSGTIAGDNNGQGVNPFAATDFNQKGICSNSARTTGPYNQICIGHDSSGAAAITVDSIAGAPPQPLKLIIDGITTLLPQTPSGGGGGGGGSAVNIVPHNAALKALAPGAFTDVVRQGFLAPGDNAPLAYFWRPTCPGAPDDGAFVAPAAGGAGCWAAAFGPRDMAVTQWGADPSGVANSAPAFRAMTAHAQNRYMIVPPGTYTFCSTVPSGYAALDPANVRILNQSNFILDLRGAILTTCNSANFSGMIQIDATIPGAAGNFAVLGGTFVGNRAGLAANQETCGIVPFSVHDFTFQGQIFQGNWGGQSAAFCGDWQTNGSYRDIAAHNVGQCFDFAFIAHTTFDGIRGYGADADGTTGTDKVGMKCFSFAYDGVNSAFNNSGDTSYSDNSDVTITNSSATNFIQGYYIASGRDYALTANRWYGNPGCPGGNVGVCGLWNGFVNSFGATINAAAGYGGVILFDGGGSVNHSVEGFVSQGESYIGNGNAVQHGGALFISTALMNPAGTDKMSDFVMTNSVARNNNNKVVDVSPLSEGKLLNVAFSPMCTSDTINQTACLGLELIKIKNSLSPMPTEVFAFDNRRGAAQSFASLVQGSGDSYRGTGTTGNTGGAAIAINPGTCGTSPTVNGNNIAGIITVGSGANPGNCTLSFSAPWINNPVCMAASSQPARQIYVAAATTTQAVFTAFTTLAPGDLITYQCIDFQ